LVKTFLKNYSGILNIINKKGRLPYTYFRINNKNEIMSNTKITLNKEYFTVEVTKAFLNDLETACKTMELDLFTALFTKYDLSFVEDYEDVLDMVNSVMASWNKPNQGTELLEVTQFDSKCLFCEYGKTVKVYKWTYQHKLAPIPMNRVLFSSQIAFFFKYEYNQLIEFGVCNGYLDKEEMNLLNS
jgi:hypothetical protein